MKGWYDGHPEIGKMQKDIFDDIFDTTDDGVSDEDDPAPIVPKPNNFEVRFNHLISCHYIDRRTFCWNLSHVSCVLCLSDFNFYRDVIIKFQSGKLCYKRLSNSKRVLCPRIWSS